ncbi:MAG: glycosyl hydrolase, partial [Akkermansiaceae bacterium]|nr:glycosyl hydrolase [Akkermansiaceae bacterium]
MNNDELSSRATTFLATLLIIASSALLGAQEKAETEGKKDGGKLNSGALSAIKLRSVGPALMSGRIADVAIDPEKPNTWYVGAGSGGVWKTENAGTTWKPVFDNYGSYSIGCVTVDPSNRNIVWVGTGENVGGRHVGYGDGIYRSVDGGNSFRNMGLKASEHISKILVHPHQSDLIYVAVQGPLWSPGGERGLYMSDDGGRTWKLILASGKYTGVTDVVFDPKNPSVLYAATHQRHRTVWAVINGGPETGIHKSVDGGKTWRELKGGLPGGDKGKIGLAVSPQDSRVVYATIELPGRTGGFWKSADGGESWAKMSDYVSGGTGPHYYQEIYVDPHRFDVIYQANVSLGRSEDGGKTWNSVESRWKHVDNHAVAFHPTDPDFLLVGCDGGLYRSFDRGRTYDYFANLPLTQFYKVDVDYDWPFYHIVGGTQDNNTQYGPSRTRSSSGILNSDWRPIIGGDGHDCAIDPK